LREDDRKGALAPEGLSSQPYLYESFSIEANQPYVGMYSLADAVQAILVNYTGITLKDASDEEVKLALHYLFSNPDTTGMKDFLSIKAESRKQLANGEQIDYWTSPALFFYVAADNEKLGSGTMEIGISGGETVEDKEEFNRNVQQILRGSQSSFRLWGIAIDANLEAADEGQTAGLFIMFTVIAAVLIAGVSLRSYWAVALTGAGLGILIIWLKGISNLVGLKEGLVIDLIVPIAMVSLGVDFAIHTLRRYGEEKGRGYFPGMALRVGFAGVLGAIVLAMASDSIAFLANVSSGIEAVIHFGIAAGIAVASSFVILGVVLPLVMMHIDGLREPGPGSPSKGRRLLIFANCIGVAALTSTSVIFLVAVSQVIGIVVLVLTVAVYLVLPLLVMNRRRSRRNEMLSSSVSDVSSGNTAISQGEVDAPGSGAGDGWFVTTVAAMARYRLLVLLAITGITAASVVFATRLEATFDAKDFFDSGSDFVISLDKLDEHIGESGGEPGIVYVKGNLSDLGALEAIDRFIAELADNPDIARIDGEAQIWARTVVALLSKITDSSYARDGVLEETGVSITDTDGDGLPDKPDQINAAYKYMLEEGVPLDENTLIYTAGEVGEVLFHDPAGGEADVTLLTVEIPGTREQQNVVNARDSLTDDLEVLKESPAITYVGLTGSPFTRLVQLDATASTLQKSLPIAAVSILALLLLVMRSLRYALVTIIPIGLVVAWLYGLMYLFGFPLNYVTATIGAVSLGVGIDYSIHMTERFREEMHRAPDKMQALRQAARGTGVALLASAASSIVGFAIMGFAPMPMFSTYGILTALMIFLALAASLAVLPSLLLLVAGEKKREKTRSD
ncbi:RND family transporter, partial [Chloroflexota bacterium]